MADRYEILRELRLLPLWRLRRAGSVAAAPLRAAATEAGRAAVVIVPGNAGDPAAGRLEHIAKLQWPEFAADVAACTACGLCETRNRPVPGVGDVHAKWLFVGEAPGAEEDARGEPFVGQAGRLLDNILASLGLKRGHDVYIANVLKCRPPGNRTPTPLEAEACRPYLDRQIALIRPALIVALGKKRGHDLAQCRCDHRQPEGPCAPLPRCAARRYLSSGLSLAQLARQGEGVGRFVSGSSHDAAAARKRSRLGLANRHGRTHLETELRILEGEPRCVSFSPSLRRRWSLLR